MPDNPASCIAQELFEEYKASIGNVNIGQTLIWILMQQDFKSGSLHGPHPRGIQYWFSYLLPILGGINMDENFASTIMHLVEGQLAFLAKASSEHIRFDDDVMPNVGIISIIALVTLITEPAAPHNLPFLKRLTNIYRNTKILVFCIDSPMIKTSAPSSLFSTMFHSLTQAKNQNLVNEVLDQSFFSKLTLIVP